ncbi:hypothetical protein [Synechococcus sp. CBW1107]|uniref:hypothetical protein n=1 Tax=Synechococcus sp. CBW1107 TaxID=2789857 RepID=UPI002AD2B5FC|nr:hypothetical protein [Synechococcus sp. CBW1107]
MVADDDHITGRELIFPEDQQTPNQVLQESLGGQGDSNAQKSCKSGNGLGESESAQLMELEVKTIPNTREMMAWIYPLLA